MISFDADVLRDFDRVSQLEWLETNGVGGWASSSLCFANTRRYHGLLVAADPNLTERTVLVAKLDEVVDGIALACNRFPGAIHPRGFEQLQSFRKDAFPVWEYAAGRVTLRKTVVAPRGQNLTIVLYEVLDCDAPFEMRLRPFLAGRGYHSLGAGAAENMLREATSAEALPTNAAGRAGYVHIDVPDGRFEASPDWWRNFEYDRERERGLDFREDLFTPGSYLVTLGRGAALPVILATTDTDRDARGMIEQERSRREALTLTSGDDFVHDLTRAADQFIIDRSADSQDVSRTVIAGYHWFTDWGRDTMISLPGLCLTTRRFDDAKQILRRWLAASSEGMIPNRFPDGTTEPAYNAVDAGLWLFVAVWRYLEATGDEAFVRGEALPALRGAIDWLDRGTRFNIHEDRDGLLYAGANGLALTWMDAVIDGEVVTPRCGKPVEVNALWYNALRIVAALTGDEAHGTRADEVRRAFESSFWNEAAGCCFDVIDPVDVSIRPNQLFALALPFPLFDDARADSILRVCESKLLTPVGLRTLAPDDPHYRGHITGDPRSRDSAYHQGTVWPWLLGPYIDALLRVRGARGRDDARRLLDNMRAHLGEAGIGTISEVFDGDAPHTPRGCIAQAWSVAEVLRTTVSCDQ